MSEHPIQGMMDTSMSKIKEMVDVNTIIGDPITSPDGTVIIPVSKVCFGFASGGSDFPSKQPKDLFGGASGAGVSIQPIAFLVVSNGDVKILNMENSDSSIDRIATIIPEIAESIRDLLQNRKSKKNEKAASTAEAASDTVTNADCDDCGVK